MLMADRRRALGGWLWISAVAGLLVYINSVSYLLSDAQGDALVAFEAYRTLVERTPEDTGRARASWNLGAEPSDAVPPAGDYPEFRGDVSAAVEQAIAKVGVDAESFSITNDLDYMPFLEAGWSEQAPAGFIALTFREAAEQLGQMAREA